MKYYLVFLLGILITKVSSSQSNSIGISGGYKVVSGNFPITIFEYFETWADSQNGFGSHLFYQRDLTSVLSVKVGVEYFNFEIQYPNSRFSAPNGFETDLRPLRTTGNVLVSDMGLVFRFVENPNWKIESSLGFLFGSGLNGGETIMRNDGVTQTLMLFEDGEEYFMGVPLGFISKYFPFDSGFSEDMFFFLDLNGQLIDFMGNETSALRFAFRTNVGVGLDF
ncbi:MAG: hypothetical protein U5L96_12495 [Owenweeksia sp.]|nr:hypothetical protein [Owenweeksia sp.]